MKNITWVFALFIFTLYINIFTRYKVHWIFFIAIECLMSEILFNVLHIMSVTAKVRVALSHKKWSWVFVITVTLQAIPQEITCLMIYRPAGSSVVGTSPSVLEV